MRQIATSQIVSGILHQGMTNARHTLPPANQLQVFDIAATHQSFSAAGHDLNVSQAAVSRMIKRLEQHLGFDLFVRKPTGVELTDQGARLHKVVHQGFSDMRGLIADIQHANATSTTVLLSLSSAFVTHWLMPRVGRLNATHPDLELQFQLVNGEPGGALGSADLGIRLKGTSDEPAAIKCFAAERIIAVCSPEYAERFGMIESPTLSESHKLIRFAEPRVTWAEFLRHADVVRRVKQREITFSDYSVVLQAALAGEGLALGWDHIVQPLLKNGHLVPACATMLSTGNSYQLVVNRKSIGKSSVGELVSWFENETARVSMA